MRITTVMLGGASAHIQRRKQRSASKNIHLRSSLMCILIGMRATLTTIGSL